MLALPCRWWIVQNSVLKEVNNFGRKKIEFFEEHNEYFSQLAHISMCEDRASFSADPGGEGGCPGADLQGEEGGGEDLPGPEHSPGGDAQHHQVSQAETNS
jgi:hypothetical protein